MSITKDFSTSIGKYSRQDVIALLAHARALEAMLKKHEWDGEGSTCPECENGYWHFRHTDDCALAKLLEGTNQ